MMVSDTVIRNPALRKASLGSKKKKKKKEKKKKKKKGEKRYIECGDV